MKILRRCFDKAILTIFCLLVLAYSQCGYAVIEKGICKDEITAQFYTKISLSEGVSTITPEIAREIVDALKDQTQVASAGRLIFACDIFNKVIFQPGTLKAILDAAQSSTTLRKIVFFNLDGKDTEQLQIIASFLATDKNLTEFTLSHSSIGDNGARIVANALALRKNKTLIMLSLEQNKIGDAGVSAIAEALQTDNSIVTLNLQHNYITDKGIEVITKVLMDDNCPLTEIILAMNDIRDDGARMLAETLKRNRTLTVLDLNMNCISAEGALAVADALLINKTLTKLDFGSNRIDNDGMIALAAALRVNTTLLDLNIFDNANAEQRCLNSEIGWPIDMQRGLQAILESLVYNMTILNVDAEWLPEQKEIVELILTRNQLMTTIKERVFGTILLLGTRPKFYDVIMYGTKEELLRYVTVEDFEQINEIRSLQLQIYHVINWPIVEALRLIEVERQPAIEIVMGTPPDIIAAETLTARRLPNVTFTGEDQQYIQRQIELQMIRGINDHKVFVATK